MCLSKNNWCLILNKQSNLLESKERGIVLELFKGQTINNKFGKLKKIWLIDREKALTLAKKGYLQRDERFRITQEFIICHLQRFFFRIDQKGRIRSH